MVSQLHARRAFPSCRFNPSESTKYAGPVYDPRHQLYHIFWQQHEAMVYPPGSGKMGAGPVWGHAVSKGWCASFRLPCCPWCGAILRGEQVKDREPQRRKRKPQRRGRSRGPKWKLWQSRRCFEGGAGKRPGAAARVGLLRAQAGDKLLCLLSAVAPKKRRSKGACPRRRRKPQRSKGRD